MKKIIAIAVSAMFLLGFAGAAFAIHAEIPTGTQAVYADEGTMLDIGGDMRVRGVWRHNFDLDSDFDTTSEWLTPKCCGLNAPVKIAEARYFDQRYRLAFIVKTDGGIEARMRAVFGSDYVWGTSASGVDWDWAYLHFPLFGGTWDVGRQRANWGHKFWVWDNPTDRIKYATHAGNVLIGALYDKKVENSPVPGTDTDDYGVFAVYAGEGVTLGAIVVYLIDDSAAESADGTLLANIYGTLDLGAAQVKFEGALSDPEAAGDTAYGAFVQVIIPLDAISIDGLFAFTKNGYVADNYFAPTAFIGTVNPTAGFDFGAHGDSWLGVITGSMMVTDTTTVGIRVAYIDISSGPIDGASAFELDAFLKQKLAKNTTYYVDFGVGFPNDWYNDDDMALTLAHKIEMLF